MIKPVFIVGCPRTGSKIYMHILNSFSEIDIMPELHFLDPIWLHKDFMWNVNKKIGDLKEDSNVYKLIDLMYSRELFGSFWDLIDLDKSNLKNKIIRSDRSFKSIFKMLLKEHAKARNKSRCGAKFPVHFIYTSILFSWFPGCKIIHLIRDARGIYASHLNKYLKKTDSSFKKILLRMKIFFYINMIYRLAAKNHDKFKRYNNYLLSRYEDIVDKPEYYLRKLCDFLEIEFKQDMIHPPVLGSSYSKYKGKGMRRGSITEWKKHISFIEAKLITIINRRSMRKFGYF